VVKWRGKKKPKKLDKNIERSGIHGENEVGHHFDRSVKRENSERRVGRNQRTQTRWSWEGGGH